jgi:hypothetical protein
LPPALTVDGLAVKISITGGGHALTETTIVAVAVSLVPSGQMFSAVKV